MLKRIPKSEAKPLVWPIVPQHCWSMDFMHDVLMNGTCFRTFNVMDDYNREALCVFADFSINSEKVILCLENIARRRGYPEILRMDNGPEFISKRLREWAEKRGIKLSHIQPGKPAQNGFIERFNRTYRDEVLDRNIFRNLDDVRLRTEAWIAHYNEERPHESLGNKSPKNFAEHRNGACPIPMLTTPTDNLSSFNWY